MGAVLQRLRGHLAEVNNEKENEFFVEQLRAHGAWTDGSGEDAAWIGAAMLRGSDKYEWVEGAHASRAFYDLNTSSAVGTNTFVKWADGEPAGRHRQLRRHQRYLRVGGRVVLPPAGLFHCRV